MKGAIIIEGHVQGLSNVRSLGERGIPIYVIDVCHCLAQYSRYCKKFFICRADLCNNYLIIENDLCIIYLENKWLRKENTK